jgi:hypothetical protein
MMFTYFRSKPKISCPSKIKRWEYFSNIEIGFYLSGSAGTSNGIATTAFLAEISVEVKYLGDAQNEL